MNQLKRSFSGKYDANDVDVLLLKVRNDYEECLKEQRDRIMAMRDENRELRMQLRGYRENEQYIIGAIARAEEAAGSVVADAKAQADEIVESAKREARQINLAAAGCLQRLCRLRDASEQIFRSVDRTVGEHESKATGNIRPFISVLEGAQLK